MKYFVISDLHGCYTPFKEALQKCGHSKDNLNHTLVVLGDIFDRGKESREIYEFLSSIPRERIVLVRGNHDYLLFKALDRDCPDAIDFYNGTLLTACQMAYKSKEVAIRKYQTIADADWTLYYGCNMQTELKKRWKTIAKRAKQSDMYKWFASSQWVNYWETNKFVGVHSFVPVTPLIRNSHSHILADVYDGRTHAFTPNPEWRTASSEDWEVATWGCPFVFMDAGFFPDHNKTLICGHYRADAFHHHYDGKELEEDFGIYCSKQIIAIDGTINYSGVANVLVINDDGTCSDQNGRKLALK